MASDWRVLQAPLGRSACDTCGLAVRDATAHGTGFYEHGYSLYAHAPDAPREMARQARYARWIADHVDTPPRHLVDLGCGNGSLLLALAAHWPGAALSGCDLSAESIARGTAAGLQLWHGGLGERPPGVTPDLIVSVNVIEHTPDPVGFLGGIRDALAGGGSLVLVCPDGSRPGVELLIADHLFSFTPAHLGVLLQRAGLTLMKTSIAPEAIGAFQMVVARADGADDVPALGNPRDLMSRRQAYLEQWRTLDQRLRPRVPANATCFGIGETTGLLRAYAPDTWSAVGSCVSDESSAGHFDGVPVRRLGDIAPGHPILLGVRPRDQPDVAGRLRRSFRQIITWYDLVDEG